MRRRARQQRAMSEPSLDLIVRDLRTTRSPEGTTLFQVRLATVAADTIAFHEVTFADEMELAAALENAKWRHTRVRVPATFVAQDDAGRCVLLCEMRNLDFKVFYGVFGEGIIE